MKILLYLKPRPVQPTIENQSAHFWEEIATGQLHVFQQKEYFYQSVPSVAHRMRLIFLIKKLWLLPPLFSSGGDNLITIPFAFLPVEAFYLHLLISPGSLRYHILY